MAPRDPEGPCHHDLPLGRPSPSTCRVIVESAILELIAHWATAVPG